MTKVTSNKNTPKKLKKFFTEEFKKEQSIRTKTYFKNNMSARQDRSYKVRIFKDDQEFIFNSAFECAEFLGYPDSAIHGGCIGKLIKQGYIKRRNCPYNNWGIEKYVEEVN